MQTNINHLRDLIEKVDCSDAIREEIIEFLDATENEITGLTDENKNLSEEILSLGTEISDLEKEKEQVENELEYMETIDCGIGEIKYIEPDNVKLKGIMDELKETLELKAKFGAGV